MKALKGSNPNKLHRRLLSRVQKDSSVASSQSSFREGNSTTQLTFDPHQVGAAQTQQRQIIKQRSQFGLPG